VGVLRSLEEREAPLVTSSYVLLETYALLHRRVGFPAVEGLRHQFTPLLEVIWVDADVHERGLDLLLARRLRELSLVDAVSFVLMRLNDLDDAFAFDPHFEREGFSPVR